MRLRSHETLATATAALLLLLLLLSPNLLSVATANTNTNQAVNQQILSFLEDPYTERIMNTYVLTSLQAIDDVNTIRYQSEEYRWKDFVAAYKIAALQGFDNRHYIIGDTVETAIVNIALFLAQARHESISTDSCDENNWTNSDQFPIHPASAACGQAGQDYQSYTCDSTRRFMQCPVDPNMVSKARTKAAWFGAPPPLFCAPRTMTGGVTPRWDPIGDFCGPARQVSDFPVPYINDTIIDGLDRSVCNAYIGQTQGLFTFDGCDPQQGCPNTDIGTKTYYDVEGCCWWGRGVIQLTGPCNIGQLNYYLTGARYDNGIASKETDRIVPYPDLNLCEQPSDICSGPPELKWVSGLYYWVFNIQEYSSSRYSFDFDTRLTASAKPAYDDPAGVVAEILNEQVSGIVNRGCPATSCPSGDVLAITDRFDYYVRSIGFIKHAYDPIANPLPDEPAAIISRDWYDPVVMCRACVGTNGNCATTATSSTVPRCIQARNLQQCIALGSGISVMCGGVTDYPTLSPIALRTATPTSVPTTRPSDQPSNSPSVVPSASPSTSAPTTTMMPTSNKTTAPTSVPTEVPSSRPTFLPTPEWTDAPTIRDPDTLIYGNCTGCFRGTRGMCIQPTTRECRDYMDRSKRRCADQFFACVIGTATPTDPGSESPSLTPSAATSAPTFRLPEGCKRCRRETSGPCQLQDGTCLEYANGVPYECPRFSILCLPITPEPSAAPSSIPSASPTQVPTFGPTGPGTDEPSAFPSAMPTSRPTTARLSSSSTTPRYGWSVPCMASSFLLCILACVFLW